MSVVHVDFVAQQRKTCCATPPEPTCANCSHRLKAHVRVGRKPGCKVVKFEGAGGMKSGMSLCGCKEWKP
jgi:hypothetical protein